MCVAFNSVCGIPLYVSFATPAMVTLLLVPCIPWLGWNTLTTFEVFDVLNGLVFNDLVPNESFESVIVPGFVLYSALLNVNFKSSLGSDVQVEPFCDLNNTPAYGCCDIVLSEFNWVSPSLAAYTL